MARYDGIADRYDELMEGGAETGWVRGAFLALVSGLVPAGHLVLDFGSGTGADAKWLASRGYRVVAYDLSSRMLDRLEDRCAEEIASGRVRAVRTDERQLFESLREGERPDAVIANFAVVNLIPDPRPLFREVATILSPGGLFIISVLNPFFWRDLRRTRFWKPCLTGLLSGVVTLQGSNHRHLVRRLRETARPGFDLLHVAGVAAFLPSSHRGERRPDWAAPRSLPERLDHLGWRAWPVRTLGKYRFLVFRRRP